MADNSELSLLHERANHEDNLHINRTSVFLNFNGFMAVALGLTKETWLMIAFSFAAFVIDLGWAKWANDASIFIRALRDAGGPRQDERVWRSLHKGNLRDKWGPLFLMSVLLPRFLTLAWCALLARQLWLLHSK